MTHEHVSQLWSRSTKGYNYSSANLALSLAERSFFYSRIVARHTIDSSTWNFLGLSKQVIEISLNNTVISYDPFILE